MKLASGRQTIKGRCHRRREDPGSQKKEAATPRWGFHKNRSKKQPGVTLRSSCPQGAFKSPRQKPLSCWSLCNLPSFVLLAASWRLFSVPNYKGLSESFFFILVCRERTIHNQPQLSSFLFSWSSLEVNLPSSCGLFIVYFFVSQRGAPTRQRRMKEKGAPLTHICRSHDVEKRLTRHAF